MPVRLFVGNLPYDATEAELREHFGQVGPLSHIFIPVDRETGRPRGFAFVEFTDRGPAEEAITRLNNQPFKGRPLSVSEARARDDRPAGPRPPGMGPRPGGPPPGRPDWSPRPPGPRPGPGGAPFGPPSESRPGRNFGPDAPRRGKAKPMRSKREERVGGPIPIRGGGRIYDVDDLEDQNASEEFDDVASSLPADDDKE